MEEGLQPREWWYVVAMVVFAVFFASDAAVAFADERGPPPPFIILICALLGAVLGFAAWLGVDKWGRHVRLVGGCWRSVGGRAGVLLTSCFVLAFLFEAAAELDGIRVMGVLLMVGMTSLLGLGGGMAVDESWKEGARVGFVLGPVALAGLNLAAGAPPSVGGFLIWSVLGVVLGGGLELVVRSLWQKLLRRG